MAIYPKSSHLYYPEIRKLVGSACFVEIAISLGGIWNPMEIEILLDGKGDNVVPPESKEGTGKYRKMLEGKVPSIASCKRIQKKMKGGHVLVWRNHPFWNLFKPDALYFENITSALLCIEGKLNETIWDSRSPYRDRAESFRYEITLDLVKEIASFKNLGALVALTAFTREAKAQRFFRPAFWASKYSREIFPEVVCKEPHLFISWPRLLRLYDDLIWAPLETTESMPWFSADTEQILGDIEHWTKEFEKHGHQLPSKALIR